MTETPSPDELRRRVTRGHPVLFPADADWARTADELRNAFADESLHVIASPTRITVLRLIDERAAHRLRPQLHALVAEFRALAGQLVGAYHADLDELTVDGVTWWPHEHGEHCLFTNADGVEADVHLDRPDLIDPGFLLHYADSTARHAELRAACVHGFHDIDRLLRLSGT